MFSSMITRFSTVIVVGSIIVQGPVSQKQHQDRALQPGETPYKTACQKAYCFSVSMWLSKEINERCSSQWTDILSPKSILPFYSQVANLTGEGEFGARSIFLILHLLCTNSPHCLQIHHLARALVFVETSFKHQHTADASQGKTRSSVEGKRSKPLSYVESSNLCIYGG